MSDSPNLTLTENQLEILLAQAAKRGAREALLEVGLHDESARNDITDMRSLLTAWRDTRGVMWKTLVQVSIMATITFISVAVWSHFKTQLH